MTSQGLGRVGCLCVLGLTLHLSSIREGQDLDWGAVGRGQSDTALRGIALTHRSSPSAGHKRPGLGSHSGQHKRGGVRASISLNRIASYLWDLGVNHRRWKDI